MSELIISWDFFRLIVVPFLIYLGYHAVNQRRPDLLNKYRKGILIALSVYFLVFCYGISIYSAFRPVEPVQSVQKQQKVQQENDNFFKPPKEPVKEGGPGFLPISQ